MNLFPRYAHFHGPSDIFIDPYGNKTLIRSFQADTFQNTKLLMSIQKDVQMQSLIQSPFLCPYRCSEIVEDTIRIQRRYLDGASLGDFLLDHPLDEHQFLAYACSLARALQILHEMDIVVQNIKPENVIITPAEEVFLVDFAISAITDDMLNSKPSFNSLILPGPEGIIRGTPIFTKETDIFQLGMVFYTMINGSLPWASINLTRIYAQLTNGTVEFPETPFSQFSPEIIVLIKKMLDPDPSKRPAMNTIADELHLINLKNPPKRRKTTNKPPISRVLSLKVPKVLFESATFGGLQLFPGDNEQTPLSNPKKANRKSTSSIIMRTRTFSDLPPLDPLKM